MKTDKYCKIETLPQDRVLSQNVDYIWLKIYLAQVPKKLLLDGGEKLNANFPRILFIFKVTSKVRQYLKSFLSSWSLGVFEIYVL
jgi:hypothetical protein